MNILQKVKACITQKMLNRNVPKIIAKKCAIEFVNSEITTLEFNEIANKRLKLEYNNLNIRKVNIGDNVNKARLLAFTKLENK